ncbi:MAG: GTPase, partial [Candidatus Omnitrophota bacterium]
SVLTQDKLFATLDPTIRKFIFPNKQKALFVDTVGFIDNLPHHLIEAFKATLEEVIEADLILHIVDVSHPKAHEHSDAVYKVLEDIGVKDVPVITVLNKADLVGDPAVLEKAKASFKSTIAISALKKEGFDVLTGAILPHISGLIAPVKITIPSSDVKTLNLIYENGLVTKKEYSGESVYIEAQVPLRIKELLESRDIIA